jgi:hypothetical protein
MLDGVNKKDLDLLESVNYILHDSFLTRLLDHEITRTKGAAGDMSGLYILLVRSRHMCTRCVCINISVE